MAEQEVFSLALKNGNPDPTKWPQLTSSTDNQLNLEGSLKLQPGVAITKFSNDVALAGNSALTIPTEQAVKTYVDNQLGPVNTALATKALLTGAASQDFTTRNLTVQGNGNAVGSLTVQKDLKVQGNLEVTGQTRCSNLEVTGDVTANKFVGDGSGLTGLTGSTQWVNGASGSISYSGGNVGIGTTTPQGKLEVSGDIRAGNSDLYFTKTDHNHTGIGNTPGWAAIENSANFGALMILGRNQGTGGNISRVVKLWDYLQVNGNLDVTGNINGRVAGIGFASAAVTNGQTIPVPTGFTTEECVFFASIKYLNFASGEAVAVHVFSNGTGKVTATPEGKVVAIGVAIAKKGGW